MCALAEFLDMRLRQAFEIRGAGHVTCTLWEEVRADQSIAMIKLKPRFLTFALLPSLASTFVISARVTAYPQVPGNKVLTSSHDQLFQFGRVFGLLSLGSSKRGDDDENEELVTKEMFLRDILEPTANDDKNKEEDGFKENSQKNREDVSVRKKKGKKRMKEYKVMDNRDILPFRVTMDTPDPYTHPEIKKKTAAKTRKQSNAVEEHFIKSTLYKENKSKKGSGGDDDCTLLGEFRLGKDTTTGDVLLIGNSEYKVIRHRCQYKYAGAQRFVMVRKILEVKEVGRILSESSLSRQWKKDSVQHPLNNDSSS